MEGQSDFVTQCFESNASIAAVDNTKISGVTLQSFLSKQRPVIYSAFCTTMVGHKHPKTDKLISRLDHVDPHVMIQVLTRDTVQILRPTDSYGIKESYTAVKLIHTFAKDPEGTQVADYIAMVTKCIWIARAMTGRQHLPEDLDKFYNSITDGKLETTQDFIESLSRDDGEATNFLFYLEKEKQLSGWRNKDMWKALLPKFTADANSYCVAQRKFAKVTLEDLISRFKTPKIQGRDADGEDHKFFENTENDTTKPYWLFYNTVAPITERLIDPHRLVSTPPFVNLDKIVTNVKKTKDLNKLLRFPWMKRSWNAMCTILILHDPLTGQRTDWIQKQTLRYWSSLKAKDFNKSPDLMQFFLEELKIRKIKISRELCMVFVKFLINCDTAITPVPELGVARPTEDEIDERHKQILHREIQEGGPSLEEQMEQRRVQLSRFPMEEPTEDSGVILPILLLGAGIFLLST
jgi:hypothetical protein